MTEADPHPRDERWLRDPALMAVGTLTAVRVPAPRSVAFPVPGRAMVLAPLVGVIPGGLAAVTCALAAVIGWGAGIQAALAIAVLALSTRGLHLDGLADFADGLAASYDRGRALAVMRTGDTGPAGMAAVVLVLLTQAAALFQVLGADLFDLAAGVNGHVDGLFYPESRGPGAGALVIAAVAGRIAVPVACVAGVPAARREGLGAVVAGSVSRFALTTTVLLTTVAAAAVGIATDAFWWRGALAVLLAAGAAGVVVRRAVTRFGGITGDVIGAAVEISTAVALLALAIR